MKTFTIWVAAGALCLACGEGAHLGEAPGDTARMTTEALGTPNVVYDPSTSAVIDGDTHFYWNQLSVDEDKVVTYGDYQYTTYWSGQDGVGPVSLGVKDLAPYFTSNNFPIHRLVLSRRRLSDNTVQRLIFTADGDILKNPYDAHFNTVIGISPIDGTLHLSYGHHGDPHHYRVSKPGFLTSPPATMTEASFTAPATQVSGGPEGDLTYPKYFNDTKGNLYFAFRNGSSGMGDLHLNRYQGAAHVWSHAGIVIMGRGAHAGTCTSAMGCDKYPGTTARGSYDMGLRFDPNDRLHVTWTWREHTGPGTAYPAISIDTAEHDVFYAYSDDLGTTWKNDDGTQVADLSRNDAITIDDPGIRAVSVPQAAYIHGGFMTLDSRNQPHLVTKRCLNYGATPDNCQAQIAHYWRTGPGGWSGRYMTDTRQYLSIYRQGYGSLVMDEADNAYLIHSEDRLGWHSEEEPYIPSKYEFQGFRWQPGGFVAGTTRSADSQISTDTIHVDIRSAKFIEIRMQNLAGASQANFQFLSSASPDTWTGRNFALLHDGPTGFSNYVIDMSTTPNWSGILTYLTLNPTSVGAPGDFKIDYIRITDAAHSVLQAWEFTEPFTLVCSESHPSDDYATHTSYTLATGQAQVKWDEGYVPDARRLKSDGIISVPSVEQNPSDGKIVYATREFRMTNRVARAWEFGENTEGWMSPRNIDDFQWEPLTSPNTWVGGRVKGTISTADAEIVTTAASLDVDLTTNKHIQIVTRNSTGATQAKFYFLTDADPTWSESKSRTFSISPNEAASSEGTTYTVDMSSVAKWTGTLRVLNYYPTAHAATPGTFSIDSIRILP